MKWAKKQGFTIVELLIVIVVIGILAAITIVAFNGVQNKAKTASVQTAVSSASKKIMVYATQNSDQFPTVLTDAGVTSGTNGVSYQFTSDNTVSQKAYCVTATSDGISYYVSSANPTTKAGICPGHNIALWDKADISTLPIPGITVDTTTYRTATASMRLGPGQTNQLLKDASPYTGVVGQLYRLSVWIKTDSNWNGTAGNSKIRFGTYPVSSSTVLTSCSFEGVKTVWTQYICSWTVTSASPQFTLGIGNDGSVGNVWLDDLVLTATP